MFPLLALAAQLLPQLVPDLSKKLGLDPSAAPKDLIDAIKDQSGAFQTQLSEATQKALDKTGTTAANTAAAATAINGNPDAKKQLSDEFAAIVDFELKERERGQDESHRVQLEMIRQEAEERDRQRTAEFRRYVRNLQDRREARTIEMQLAEEHSPLAWVAPILAFALVLMIAYLLRGIMLSREPVINKDVFNVVLGALVTAFTTVVAYYFGSSLGSTKKDQAVRSGQLVTRSNTGAEGGEIGLPLPFPLPTRADAASKPAQAGGGGAAKKTSGPPPSGPYGLFRQKAPDLVRNLIRDIGITETQAAGILGNIGWECGGFKHLVEQNPVMGGPGGLGWCQWTASRRTDFEGWLKAHGVNDYRNDDANYGFLLSELRGSQAGSIRALRQTRDIESATSEFMNVFERPARQYAHLDDRIGLAKLALQDYRSAYNG
jgi:hypothetical protein